MDATLFLLLNCLGLVITAQAQACPKPVGGPNMDLKGDSILLQEFPDGTTVTFVCNVGFETAGGSGVITCNAGTWSTVRLRCQKKNCGAAEEVENGHIDYSEGTEFGAKIVITCNDGYTFVGKKGPREIFCGDGAWQGRMPVCEAVTCDTPPRIINGTFSPVKDYYSYGEVIQYSCKNNLPLIGSKSAFCSNDGQFDPPVAPNCSSVKCSDPDIPNADWVGGSRPPYGYKSTVTYKCRTGYMMEGHATQMCGANSQWSPGLPTCKVVTCSTPPAVVNGSFSPVKDPYQYKDVVQYTCRSGFILKGSKSITCSDGGTFNPDPPKCTMVTCNPPPAVEYGDYSPVKESYQYRDVVQYLCRLGYNLTGPKSISCSDDETFKPDPPTCKMVTCNLLPVVANAAVSPTKNIYSYGDVVEFSCKRGFNLSGSKSVSCLDDGTFKPDLPVCTMVTCRLPVVVDAYVSSTKESYRYGDVAEFSCKKGLTLIGTKSLKCSDDGTFKPEPPTCAKIPKPPTTTTATPPTGDGGSSIVIPVVIVIIVIIIGGIICCGIYFFGIPGLVKGKRRKQRCPVAPTLMDVKLTG